MMERHEPKYYRKVHTTDYLYHTPKPRKNKYLNAKKRDQIESLLSQGLTPCAIGKVLGRASNTFRSELKQGAMF